MKTVYQEDTNGCWIACAAMLSGKPYEEIKAMHRFQKEVTGRSAKPLIELLAQLGVRCESKSTKVEAIGALRELDCNALIYFKNLSKKGKERGGHWMVWDHCEQVIRDPEGWTHETTMRLKNFRRVLSQ